MIIVQIPKDIKKIERKALFGLTVRQLVCLGIGSILGIITFFISQLLIRNVTTSLLVLIFTAMPIYFLSMYERNGFRMEQIIKQNIYKKIKSDSRPYKAEYIKEIRELKQ